MLLRLTFLKVSICALLRSTISNGRSWYILWECSRTFAFPISKSMDSLYFNVNSVAETQFHFQEGAQHHLRVLFVRPSSGMFSNLIFSRLESASNYEFLSSISLTKALSSSLTFCRSVRLDFMLSSSFCIFSAVVFFMFRLRLNVLEDLRHHAWW